MNDTATITLTDVELDALCRLISQAGRKIDSDHKLFMDIAGNKDMPIHARKQAAKNAAVLLSEWKEAAHLEELTTEAYVNMVVHGRGKA